ncbi:hypothetical protein DEI99_005255 [Curtobacterium sp. MCLR17_036]|uniref:VG15 protein n=1 Tax=Curtobacterium sp. MCLR17_036 TaxID=2175620 RepID=UPI000DAA13B9|nr:hypothetical protein [Curtobacterium sp. MCLR17_036]WIE65947.1 hypothetical protein DEI99_005255 [Curtobacterium sp. MCLR17_036]
MTTRADVDTLRDAGQGVVTLARRDLQSFWSSLDLTRPEAARDELLEFVPQLVREYGDVAATVAAEWYEQVRYEQAGAYNATTVNTTNVEQIRAGVRANAGQLFTDTPDVMLALLSGGVQRYVLASQRGTIARNVQLDPSKPRFARVPTGAKTCAWCTLLASRGFVYLTAQTAGVSDHYHSECNCQAVAEWEADRHYIAGYDPDAMYEKYQDARAAANSLGLPLTDANIATQMRALYPGDFTDGHTH